jgi:hypothetical protein
VTPCEKIPHGVLPRSDLPMKKSSPVLSSRLRIAFCIWLGIGAWLVSGCGRKLASTATLPVTVQAAGHTIVAEIEGTPVIDRQPGFAVIGGPHGRVTVERNRVRLDELAWTAIPADVPVNISIKRHDVKISAGGTTIRRTTSD